MPRSQQKEIEGELADKTMIGEYIGSPDHQHLVKYGRISLIFYSVVENNSEEICWPC
jgi:hypothetical protein